MFTVSKRLMKRLMAGSACLAALALPAQPASADTVQRCEDNAGRITYSNEACPPGTRRSRTVDTSEPVVGGARAAAAAAARADDAKGDGKGDPRSDDRTEKSDKADKADAGSAAKADSRADAADKSAGAERRARAAEGKIATRSVQIDRTPSQPATPVAVRKDALCRDLATRARFARQDLDAALPSQRASAELALRRAQEEHDTECRTR